MPKLVPAAVLALFAFAAPIAQGALAVRCQLVGPVSGPLDDDEVKNVFQHHLGSFRRCAANDDFVKKKGSSWLTSPTDFPKCAKEQVSRFTFSSKDPPSHALVNVIVN